MWRKRFWKATHNYHVDVAGTILLGVLIIEGNLANMMLYLQSLIQWNTSHLQSSILQKAVDRHRTKIGWRDNNTPMSMNMLKFSTTNPAFGNSNLIQPMNCTKTILQGSNGLPGNNSHTSKKLMTSLLTACPGPHRTYEIMTGHCLHILLFLQWLLSSLPLRIPLWC